MASAPEHHDQAPEAVEYLRTLRAIRDRCGILHELAKQDKLEHFALREDKIEGVHRRFEVQSAFADAALPQTPPTLSSKSCAMRTRKARRASSSTPGPLQRIDAPPMGLMVASGSV